MSDEMRPNFEGHAERECGDHRTVGPHRAWCYDCHEWCYPEGACRGCELPGLRAENERLREALRQVHEIANRPDLWTEEVVERVIDRVSDALAAASLSETGGEGA